MDLQGIRHALQSADEETRRSALYLLRDIPCPEVQALYFTAMGDESWRVRKEAVECYVYSNPDLNSIEQLLTLLRNEDNAGLRNSAAEAVIRLGSASASPLMKMVQDQDADVRKFVIDVMGAIGDPVFVPALLQALDDPEVNVASAAAEQLGALGDAEAAQYLMQAILAREEVLFRFSALGSLGSLAKPAPVPEALAKLAEQDILRKAVFECLGNVSDESSYKLLLNGFSCRQKNCRAAAVKALYKIYGRCSSGSQAKIREALQLLKENDIITGLLELFDNRDRVLTEALLWTSVVTMDARFIPLLIKAYTDERTADAALSALKSFGREALYEIISRYSTLDESGRCGLCILIAECEYSGFNDVIQEALRDQSAQVRKAAVEAIGANRIDASASMLVLALVDEDTDVRIAVADALGNLHDSTTLSALEHALNDENVWVQSAVLKAIARIEPIRALSIINNIHAGAEGLLMITSLKILEEIGGSESEEIVRYALQSSDQDIVRQAAKSLERLIATNSN